MKKLGFWIVLVLIVFVSAEFALRVYQRVIRDVPMTSLIPGWRPNRFPMSSFLVFGPRVDWQIPDKRFPDLAYFNRQAFRSKELIGPKDDDEIRIIALGGSTTEGIWNEAGIHWPLVTECALRENGYGNVRVLNTAMSAYTTAHSLVRLGLDVVDYQPDYVLVMHNINDLGATYDAAQLGEPLDPHYFVTFGQQRFTGDLSEDDIAISRIGWGVRKRLEDLGGSEPALVEEYDLEPGLRLFSRNLRSIHGVAGIHGSETVFLTMPYAIQMADQLRTALGTDEVGIRLPVSAENLNRDMRAFNEATLQLAKELGAHVVDMNARLGSADSLFADLVHYTTKGELEFGETLAPELARILDGRTPNGEEKRNYPKSFRCSSLRVMIEAPM